MLYSEIPLIYINGVFQHMGRTFPAVDNKILDNLMVSNYGQRTLSPFTINTLGLIDDGEPTDSEWLLMCDTIKSMYDSKWSREEEIFNLVYNPDDAYSYTHTNTVDDDTSETTKSSRLDVNKEFGFDSGETGSDKSSLDSGGETKVIHDGNKTITIERHGNVTDSTSKTKQEIFIQELEFRKHNHIYEVLKDVANLLTLQVY